MVDKEDPNCSWVRKPALSQTWWFISVISVTQEAEIGV
jgi:hypothetical protein